MQDQTTQQNYETFTWKSDGKIFKGVGVYHLTFVVSGRKKLLGEVRGADNATVKRFLDMNATALSPEERTATVSERQKLAWMELTPYGKAVDDVLRHYDDEHEGIKVCARKVLDDHFHVVLWVQRQQVSTIQKKPQSILQIAYGLRVQLTHLAQDMGVWPKGVRVEGALHAEKGTGHVFEKQFVRTLSRSGQLRPMIDYVLLNVYRKWVKQNNQDLFTLHKDTIVEDLRFRSMGNLWLLDWPVRQMVECSRSETQTDWDNKLAKVLKNAETGAVTYTAAISKGESYIARKVREAGWPLVILMKDGFPPEGSENEKYFKPGGVYFETCANEKLLLMEAYTETYEASRIVEATEDALKKKSEKKGWSYNPLPHNIMRWRFMAGNEMMRMLSER